MSRPKLAGISTSHLEYLRAALDHDTWRDAAAAVGVSPSALSQGLAELERRLGLVLFERDRRNRVPTSEAHHVGRFATRMLAELRELSRWAEEVRTGASGEVSVGMIDTAAIHHFGDTLVGFRNDNPDLTVRLFVQPSNRLLELLVAGEVDVVVAVEPPADDQFVVEPLLAEPLYAYAPPGQAKRSRAASGPWVGFPADSRTRALTARNLRRLGATYEVVAESSQPAVLREMVRLGMGWCVLPASDGEAEPHALQRAAPDPIAQRTLALVRRRDRDPSAALQRLIDALSGLTSPQPASGASVAPGQ
ncbi:MAG: LysR family transcriptional regulator [Actinomycetota bacterium]